MARPNKYANMKQEEFNRILQECVIDNAETLLGIPGAYEVLSEHFNNDVLQTWSDENGLPYDDEYDAIWNAIEALDRSQLVKVLEEYAGIQCYDHESDEVLQQAVYQCIMDEDLVLEDLDV